MGKRMFVATDLSRGLAAGLAALDPRIDGLHWIPAERLHLTLCFLGNVEDDDEHALKASLEGLAGETFSAAVKGLGCFRSRGGLVVWAGLEDPEEQLRALSGRVVAAVREAGIAPEGKAFRPHITVGRSRHAPSPALRDFLRRNADRDFGRFEVTGVTLYSSVLRPEGPEYRQEFRRSFAP